MGLEAAPHIRCRTSLHLHCFDTQNKRARLSLSNNYGHPATGCWPKDIRQFAGLSVQGFGSKKTFFCEKVNKMTVNTLNHNVRKTCLLAQCVLHTQGKSKDQRLLQVIRIASRILRACQVPFRTGHTTCLDFEDCSTRRRPASQHSFSDFHKLHKTCSLV